MTPTRHSYAAKRLPTYAGPAGWDAILPPRRPSATLTTTLHADITIIGAGLAGLAAAHRLVQLDPTLNIAVLEAGLVAQGSAGRNSGFMIDLPHALSSSDYSGSSADSDRLQIRHNRAAIEFATQLATELNLGKEVFDRCGKINGAAGARGHTLNLEYAQHLHAIDEEYELLDAAQMRAITGTDYYHSGLYTPGTAMLQPAAYVRALADALPPQVSVFERSPVNRIDKQGNDWIVTTGQGQARSTTVIMAINGHIESFGLFQQRLLHVFTYASMSHALSSEQYRQLGGQAQWSLTPADPMGVTVRKIQSAQGARLLVRSRFTCDPSMQVSPARLRSIQTLHAEKFRQRFPRLRLSTEYCWGGQLCLSLNDVPAFGEVEPGLIAACCQNGLGLTRGTLAGMAAAELATATESVFVRELQQLATPQKLYPEPLTRIGANVVMRYKELQAGQE